jgi:hypothetical protein
VEAKSGGDIKTEREKLETKILHIKKAGPRKEVKLA